jgi:hypothetical protein
VKAIQRFPLYIPIGREISHSTAQIHGSIFVFVPHSWSNCQWGNTSLEMPCKYRYWLPVSRYDKPCEPAKRSLTTHNHTCMLNCCRHSFR